MLRYTDTSGNPGCINEVLYDYSGIDGTDGWRLIQSIQGHIAWEGVLDGLVRREGVSAIFMDPDLPVIDGKQTAYFYYDETSPIPSLAQIRVISDELVPVGGV